MVSIDNDAMTIALTVFEHGKKLTEMVASRDQI